MGRRTMPTECAHGVTVDWGDFGPCQDCADHAPGACPNYESCPQCALAPPGYDLALICWQFNEAVSLLREARGYLPEATGLAEEIDEGLPAIQAALESLAHEVSL